MAATTSKGIQYPTSGDNITPLETHFANLAESADAAIQDSLVAQGVPAGGSTGQILAKDTATDYDTTWIDNYTSQVKHIVKAGEALTKGQPVYVSSANGTNIIVSISSNATEARSSKTMGLIAQDLANNGQGYVISEGLLSGLDTSASGAAGDAVWLGVNGALIYGTGSIPTAPAHMVYLGVVTRKHANQGEIFVKVQNGFELNELHNVAIPTPADNNLLAYDSATSLWTNQTADAANIVAKTGDQTIAGTKTFSNDVITPNLVDKSSTQTISGTKTFTSNVTFGSGATTYNSNWYRSYSNTGWFNETYGGGIYMTDTDWIRTFNSKGFYVGGAQLRASEIYSEGRNWSPYTPYAVATGVTNLSGTSARSQSATVTFPAGRFTAAPNVTATVNSAGAVTLNTAVYNITASSFTLNGTHVDASNWAGPYPFQWIAIQM